MSQKKYNNVFISYSHRDQSLKDSIVKELRARPDFDNDYWEDSRLNTGDPWFKKIEEAIDQSNSVVLLASKNFFNSDFIKEHELKKFLERMDRSKMVRQGDDYNPIKFVIVPIGEEATENIREANLDNIQVAGDLDVPFDVQQKDVTDKNEARENRALVVKKIVSEICRGIDRIKFDLEERLRKENRPVEIVRIIKRGKRANLYQGRIAWKPEREVVIKTLAEVAGQKDKWRFFDELPKDSDVTEIANVVSIYWTDLTAQPPYFVMKYVEHGSLNHFIEDCGSLNWNIVQDVLLKIGGALNAARNRGLLQQFNFDLRPSHVMVEVRNGQPEPFLSFAPRSSESAGLRFTEGPNVADPGSEDAERFAYVLPESVNTRITSPPPDVSDMYLLGLMGIHMLTGQLPEAPTLMKPGGNERPSFSFPSRNIVPRRTNPFEQWDSWTYLAMVLSRMAATAPGDRFESLGDALSALRRPRRYVLQEVRDSYNHCGSPDIFREFYKAFFTRQPDAESFFKHFGATSVGTGEHWRRQKRQVDQAIALLFAYFGEHARIDDLGETPDSSISVLSYFGERHKSILDQRKSDPDSPAEGFDPDWFDDWVDCLAAIAAKSDKRLRDSNDSEVERRRQLVEEQWRQVMRPGTDFLKSFHSSGH